MTCGQLGRVLKEVFVAHCFKGIERSNASRVCSRNFEGRELETQTDYSRVDVSFDVAERFRLSEMRKYAQASGHGSVVSSVGRLAGVLS